MLLLALQTASPAGDDRIEVLALLLVVVFIGSMAALSFLLSRRGSDDAGDAPPISPPTASEPLPAPHAPPIPDRENSRIQPPASAPVWLDGVRFPGVATDLSAATRIIETLLAARRDRDLARVVDCSTPAFHIELAGRLGIDPSDLPNMLERAEFGADPPALRSIESVEASANQMIVRAGYTNGVHERYRLLRISDRWLIDDIYPAPSAPRGERDHG